MRALLVENYAAVEALSIRDVPCPHVSPGLVRVRVKAAGIGFVEALKIAGRYQTKDPLPFIPGTEFAGLVEEVGEDLAWPKVGERVFGPCARGAFADEVCVAASDLWRIPDRLCFAQAAAVPVNYLTAAYGLIELATLREGQNLLVLGAAGGTGTAAMKIARMRGANIIAAAASDEKLIFVRANGAHQAIDYTTDDWRKTLTAMTDGRAMDVVFDAVGGDVSPTAFRTLGWRGRHLVVGFGRGSHSHFAHGHSVVEGSVFGRRRQRANPQARARGLRPACQTNSAMARRRGRRTAAEHVVCLRALSRRFRCNPLKTRARQNRRRNVARDQGTAERARTMPLSRSAARRAPNKLASAVELPPEVVAN